MTKEGTVLAYKVLGEKGEAFHGGTGRWHLPENGKPGRWMQVKGEIVPCENGLHLCRKEDLIKWLGPTIWVAEYEGEPVVESDKIVVRKARLVAPTNWNAQTQRLFATDCATRAMRQLRKQGIEPGHRSLEAIRVARRYAVGKATEEELAAARSAAESAAESARYAAWSAAWSAAESARSAAESARSAAWSAARYAAWYAAESARSAAESAAGYAAGYAAWSAERSWQTKRLFHYLLKKADD